MKTKIKTHSYPGDISRQAKTAIMEGRHPEAKRANALKKEVLKRERAVLKERLLYRLKSED